MLGPLLIFIWQTCICLLINEWGFTTQNNEQPKCDGCLHWSTPINDHVSMGESYEIPSEWKFNYYCQPNKAKSLPFVVSHKPSPDSNWFVRKPHYRTISVLIHSRNVNHDMRRPNFSLKLASSHSYWIFTSHELESQRSAAEKIKIDCILLNQQKFSSNLILFFEGNKIYDPFEQCALSTGMKNAEINRIFGNCDMK